MKEEVVNEISKHKHDELDQELSHEKPKKSTYSSKFGKPFRSKYLPKDVKPTKPVKEEVEDLSELSKKTLKSYVAGAKWDRDFTIKSANRAGEMSKDEKSSGKSGKGWDDEKDYLTKHAKKRSAGVGKAVMKIMNKEETVNEEPACVVTTSGKKPGPTKSFGLLRIPKENKYGEVATGYVNKTNDMKEELENHISVNELPGNMHKTNPRTKTVDSLRGREKAPKDFHNKHISYKVELESSPVAEDKDNDPPFDGGHPSPKEHKDSTGNTIKHFAKHLAKRGMAAVQKKSKVKEDVEDLSELSKSTLGSYIKKATKNAVEYKAHERGAKHYANKLDAETGYKPGPADAYHDDADKFRLKSDSRQKGVHRAVDKLTNEHKGPDAGDTFATNDNTSSSPSPLKLAKDLAQSSFKKIRKETMGDK